MNKEEAFKWFKKGVEAMFGYFNAPKFCDMDIFWDEYEENFGIMWDNE